MWLQPVGIPDALNRVLADTMLLRHRPAAPICGCLSFGMQCVVDDLRHLCSGDRRGSPPTRRNVCQGLRAALRKPSPRGNDCGTRHAHFLGDLLVRHPLCGGQNNPHADGDRLRRLVCLFPSDEGSTFVRSDCQWRCCNSHWRSIFSPSPCVQSFAGHYTRGPAGAGVCCSRAAWAGRGTGGAGCCGRSGSSGPRRGSRVGPASPRR